MKLGTIQEGILSLLNEMVFHNSCKEEGSGMLRLIPVPKWYAKVNSGAKVVC